MMRALRVLAEWNNFAEKRFERESHLGPEHIACDCSGLINLLFESLDLLFPYGLERPKAVHYFNILQEVGSNHISRLKPGSLLAWRKDVLPGSGDTGHILVIAEEPRPVENNRFIVEVYDSSKVSTGLARREVIFHVDERGKVIGVQLDLDAKKVKRTSIYFAPIEGTRNCFGCGLPKKVCSCRQVKASTSSPHIVILRHPEERGRTLSTVSLIKQRYPEVLVKEGEVFHPLRVDNPVLLFPGGDNYIAEQKETLKKDKTFILLDATWRKAKKMMHVNPWLQALPRVSIEVGDLSRYLIRKVPNDQSLSTVEAFAAIAQDVQLNELFGRFVERQIELMGEEVYLRNYSGHLNYRGD